jgi:signal transduction histidine kinase
MNPVPPTWTFYGYVLAYAAAVVGCGVGIHRAVDIEDPETRRGLVGLLAGSGGWALFELAFLVAPTDDLAYVGYMISLVVGLGTVGAWLYFASAYTGRSFHRNTTYRRIGVAVYLSIVGVKLTNPIHGLYFTTAFVTQPFPHLTVQHGTVHWVVTGLSYALVAVGFFMLFEFFLEADFETRSLGGLGVVTGLPVLFDIAGYTTPYLIDINHEPLGVAVFAVGVLYVFEDRFLAIRLSDGIDEGLIYLDADDRIREYNETAVEEFPSLEGSTGEGLEPTLPAVADHLDTGNAALKRRHAGEQRYYFVGDTSVSLGQARIGRIVVITDVTESERRRRELQRHDDQLEGFAAGLRHELLNRINVAEGNIQLAGDALERGDVAEAQEALRAAAEVNDRMTDIVGEFATLARHARTVENTRPTPVTEVAERALESVGSDELTLSVEPDSRATIEANTDRLRELFERVFRFADWNEASAVTITLDTDRLVITDDGDPVENTDVGELFEYGTAVPATEIGEVFPMLRSLGRIHGWETSIDTGYQDGARIVISGVAAGQPVAA